MSFFPLPQARKSQEVVINEIDSVFQSGKKIILLEAPVGSGKSAIAMTFARKIAAQGKTSHVITPRKSLQDQYYSDFYDDVVLMKGRNAYPCIIDDAPAKFIPILKDIGKGIPPPQPRYDESCATGDCVGNRAVFTLCTQDRDCPYTTAMELAQSSPTVVHNLHSFIYQSSFAEKFQARDLLIIDEAHDIEGVIRDFVARELSVETPIGFPFTVENNTREEWMAFLLQDELVPVETTKERAAKEVDPAYQSRRDVYLAQVGAIFGSPLFEKKFSCERSPRQLPGSKSKEYLDLKFIPHSLGGEPTRYLFDFGAKVLLMSGTIYSKEQFCATLGLSLDDVHFIRIGSSFPVENRPIYAKAKYQTGTSHALWGENLPTIVKKIQDIMGIFKDVKGLIHAPSYAAAEQLVRELKSPRVLTHRPEDFLRRLEEFFAAPGNGVFLSPICQQGVDFKGDRARFQIILRVPYPSTSSEFVQSKVKEDFAWYNYQALVVFGQQLGRVNRSESDYGATFLMDERFAKFIGKNTSHLPKWVKDAIVWK